jgi:hypothetical protein
MNGINQKIWTQELTNSTLLITEDFGLSSISLVLKSGTGSVDGTLILENSVPSNPINLVVGIPLTITGYTALDGISIVTTGVISIIGKQ